MTKITDPGCPRCGATADHCDLINGLVETRKKQEAELDRLRANCGDLRAERLDVLAKLSQYNQAGFDGGSLAGAVAAELTQWREAYEGQRDELNVRRSRLQIPLSDPDDVKPDQVVVDPANKRVFVSVWMQDSCLLAYLREEYVVDKDLREAEFPIDSNECKLRDGWSVIRVSATKFADVRDECERLRTTQDARHAYRAEMLAASEHANEGLRRLLGNALKLVLDEWPENHPNIAAWASEVRLVTEGPGRPQWRLSGGEPLGDDVRAAMYWQCRCGHTVMVDAQPLNPSYVPHVEKRRHEAECPLEGLEGGGDGEG